MSSAVAASFQAYRSHEVVAYHVGLRQPVSSGGARDILDSELAEVSGGGFWSFVSKILIIGGAAAILGGITAGAFFLVGGFAVDDWWQG
jgi:hypothetical protein